MERVGQTAVLGEDCRHGSQPRPGAFDYSPLAGCRPRPSCFCLVAVVMLTTFGIEDYIFASLRAGASGFLLKDATPEQLLAGIRAVASGEMLLAPDVTRRIIENFMTGAPRLEDGPLAALTERERDVLSEVAAGRSNAEIGAALFISEGTVKTHVSRVLAKLQLRDRVQAVIAAYEYGLVEPRRRPG